MTTQHLDTARLMHAGYFGNDTTMCDEQLKQESKAEPQTSWLPPLMIWETTFAPFRDGETNVILIALTTTNKPPLPG